MNLSALNLIPHAAGVPGLPPVVAAEVVAPAPGSFSDPLFVVIPSWRRDLWFEIAAPDWPACHGRTLPRAGAACTVLVDHERKMTCAVWAGATTYPTGPVTA